MSESKIKWAKQTIEKKDAAPEVKEMKYVGASRLQKSMYGKKG